MRWVSEMMDEADKRKTEVARIKSGNTSPEEREAQISNMADKIIQMSGHKRDIVQLLRELDEAAYIRGQQSTIDYVRLMLHQWDIR